jgi:hypothetical protein
MGVWMYQTIKDNIINPKALIARTKERLPKTIGYFFLLTAFLALPAMIDVLSFSTLNPNDKTSIRQALIGELDIPCQIDGTLVCSTDETYTFDQGDIQFVIDPTSSFQPEGNNVVVILQQSRAIAFVNNLMIVSSNYIASSDDLIQWPSAWQPLEFNVSEESFWTALFTGLDELLVNYSAIWKSSFVLSLLISAFFVFIVDVLLDSVILKFVLRTTQSFSSVTKIVIHSMTLFVLIQVLLGLFQIQIPTFTRLLLQLQPIIYSVIAIRLPKEPTIDV